MIIHAISTMGGQHEESQEEMNTQGSRLVQKNLLRFVYRAKRNGMYITYWVFLMWVPTHWIPAFNGFSFFAGEDAYNAQGWNQPNC